MREFVGLTSGDDIFTGLTFLCKISLHLDSSRSRHTRHKATNRGEKSVQYFAACDTVKHLRKSCLIPLIYGKENSGPKIHYNRFKTAENTAETQVIHNRGEVSGFLKIS